MRFNVLIAPDKFKGTLSAREAALALARGWLRERKQDRVRLLPITDGGDGFGSVMAGLLGARTLTARTVNAAHQPCRARWWWEPQTRTAIIESATIIGLAMLPAGRFHPSELDTYGLGRVLDAARKRGARRCLVGIGGSATNDGGFGLARALGWRFTDAKGDAIERWTGLSRLATIHPPAKRWRAPGILVAVDVGNPLRGRRGATRIYGPQKGLRAEELAGADACLARLAEVYRRSFGRDLADVPGAGAAGGLGFGLMAFAGGKTEAGFRLFAHQAQLTHCVHSADLVLTGEGALDQSSFMGKGVGELARECRKHRVPCLALVGSVNPEARQRSFFERTLALTDLTSRKAAQTRAAFWLEQLARAAAKTYRPGS